jgi:hypothetical protein
MILTALFVLSASLTLAQETEMKIEFLGMKDGCPNTPRMWKSLNEAMHELAWNITVDSLDVFDLSKKKDVRAEYGSPTILVNGKDIFGASPSGSTNPACRYYRDGVPGTTEIAAKLRALRQ